MGKQRRRTIPDGALKYLNPPATAGVKKTIMTPEQEIKQKMKGKGVTAYRLSKDLKIPESTLSRNLNGLNPMSLENYLAIKEYLSKL